jgi:hypothetical protein
MTTGKHQRGLIGAGLTLALGCARSPHAHVLPYTTPPQHEGCPQEHKARRARGAWHGGASRGSPWFNEQSCNTTTCYRERPTLRPRLATVSGSHRCGVTQRPSMEKRWRGAHGARQLEDAPTGKIKEGKQRMRGQGCGSAHVRSAMQSSPARRRRRRRGDVHGGVLLPTLRRLPLRRERLLPLPRRLVWPLSFTGAPQQRRVGGDATPDSFLPASTPLPPLKWRSQEKGGNRNTGWWEVTATPGSPYRVLVKALRG